MNVSVEISLYPLDGAYEGPIVEFIHRLREYPSVTVATNALSTQLNGPYAMVMAALTESMKPTLAAERKAAFVLKILNVAIEPGASVEV